MNRTTKILWWIIALLVILNLTTIGTILVRAKAMGEEELAIVLDEDQSSPLTGRFFRQNLGFNDAQMVQFREARRTFQYAANELIFEMDSLKSEMFAELNKQTPDTARLNNLSDQVGNRHAELKKITNDFYLKLKKMCSETQCEQLQQTFLPLFRDGTVNRGRGYQWNDSIATGQGHRHRYGRGGRSE